MLLLLLLKPGAPVLRLLSGTSLEHYQAAQRMGLGCISQHGKLSTPASAELRLSTPPHFRSRGIDVTDSHPYKGV